MGDIYCKICGEPWDTYGVRHGDMEEWEAKLFLEGKGCPCCDFGKKARKTILSPELKRNLIESLAFALNTTTKDRTVKRLVVAEFIHSLNRKHWLYNDEVDPLIHAAYTLIK